VMSDVRSEPHSAQADLEHEIAASVPAPAPSPQRSTEPS
jgi:hypothetical protein